MTSNRQIQATHLPVNSCQKKTKIHFIKGTQNIDYYRKDVENHHGALWYEKWYCLLAPCLTVHSVHGAPATGGTFTPAIADNIEIFVVIEFSNGCFWLTKWLLIVLADYNIHILSYKNATCCSYGCISFFAECKHNSSMHWAIRLHIYIVIAMDLFAAFWVLNNKLWLKFNLSSMYVCLIVLLCLQGMYVYSTNKQIWTKINFISPV